jgi:hypothetical protein
MEERVLQFAAGVLVGIAATVGVALASIVVSLARLR